ncbi:MAG: hypothetical protein ACLPVF_17400 [Acidimicrobiales bacterium]
MRRRPRRSGRVLTGALLLGAAGAALAPAGPDALVPFKALAAAAADQVYVAVVVDFGNGTTTSHCVPVSPGTTDLQALSQVYPVVQNDSGLICDIDDYPTSDTSQCLRTNGAGEFYYWSYWHGSTGSWQYADTGPASSTASSGDVEGWRFQNPGPDNPSAPAPEAEPSYQAICGSSVNPTTTLPPAPTPTTATTPPSSPTPTTTTAPHAASSSATGAKAVAGSGASSHAATSTTAAGAHATDASGGSRHEGTRDEHGSTRAALAAAKAPGSGSGGAPVLPLVLVVAVVALLAGLGYLQWRRRSAEE